jgi:hypothetical protein
MISARIFEAAKSADKYGLEREKAPYTSVQTAGLSAAIELPACFQQTAIFFPLLAL